MVALSFKENSTPVRPPSGPDAGRNMWAKDESQPGFGDGTKLDAAFINTFVGMLRYLFDESGVPQIWADDSLLAQAISAYVATSVTGQFYTQAETDALLALKAPTARTLTGQGLVQTIGDLSADRNINVPIASQAEAEAGVINTVGMTPLRTAQAIAALAGEGGGSGVTAAELAGALYGNVDVASAATCNILGAASLLVSITGAVTITSLGTGADRWRLVTFTGAPLITHHATSLICQTGANIQAAAGDCMLVRSDASSNARIVGYWKANGQPLALTSGLITTALGFTPVTNARTISTNGLLTGGGDLSANRTFDVPLASQAEAEAGVNNTKAMSPLRTAQAIANLAVASFNARVGAVTLLLADVTGALGYTPVTNARTLTGSGLVGSTIGDLSANRTIDVPIASQAEAEAGSIATKAMTPQRTSQAIAALAPVRSIANATGAAAGSGGTLTNVVLSLASGVLTLTKTYISGSGGGDGGGDGG